MVDLSQWRAAIGLWHCRLSSPSHQLGSRKSHNNSNQPEVTDPLDWMIHNETTGTGAGVCGVKFSWLVGCSCFLLKIFLLFQLILLLSGDVELNPGPINIERGKYGMHCRSNSLIR